MTLGLRRAHVACAYGLRSALVLTLRVATLKRRAGPL
jgi:hypothetical protein